MPLGQAARHVPNQEQQTESSSIIVNKHPMSRRHRMFLFFMIQPQENWTKTLAIPFQQAYNTDPGVSQIFAQGFQAKVSWVKKEDEPHEQPGTYSTKYRSLSQ